MRFEKVSYKQYVEAIGDEQIDLLNEYNDIKIPKRATKGSAGYDFYAPFTFNLLPNESIKIPTGIRVLLDEDKYLAIFPRSGLGFKYRLQIDNTVGIIDSDYSNSDNEGHIYIKITNDSRENKPLVINKGDGFAQGIISSYYIVDDDNSDGVRNGGFGSTTS